MSLIRTVLVQLDSTVAAALRLRTAQALAARHGALLTGVFVAEPPPAPMATVVSERPAELLLRADQAAYGQARALFEALRAEGLAPMAWREPGPDGGLADLLAEAAYADLLVLGAHDPGQPQGPPAGLAEAALAASGRPALVLPSASACPFEPRLVLVGWDASPGAVRALAAAGPWLQAAQRVMVLDGSRPSGQAEAPIYPYLRRHGIEAEAVHWPHANEAPGEALRGLARREAVDLLVLGCQSHGLLQQRLFGGVAHTVLQQPPVALLMAH